MQLLSPAKINLSLKVGPVDTSGYHSVDTIIHLLQFGDIVTFEPAETLSVTTSVNLGIDQKENLAYRAATHMGEVFGQNPAFHIHIEKHIPHGAGLGGGSSNAATVIAKLAQRWHVMPNDERCLAIARSLGSDVCAFLAPTPCSRMGGYGDRLEESLPAHTGRPVALVMVPNAHASTAEVYRTFDSVGASEPTTLLINDLAKAAIEVCPQTGDALRWLEDQPQVEQAQVSGSGAACFALLASAEEAQALAEAAQESGLWAVATALG